MYVMCSEVYAEDLHEAAFAQQYVRSVEWAVSRLPASSLRASMELKTIAERWLAILATFTALVTSSLFVSVLTPPAKGQRRSYMIYDI